MNRCNSPEHPHCTVWVSPGEPLCAHGHRQAVVEELTYGATQLGSSFDMLSRVRTERTGQDAAAAAPQPAAARRPHLHVSGFDPRAAGGRQTIRLDLRGMPDDCPAQLSVALESALLPGGAGRHQFSRTLRGDWRPVFIEFSSRGREHGQYRIDLELHGAAPDAPTLARTWVATMVLLVPRPDASLGDIHQTFMATHKNVRINADDAAIARMSGLSGLAGAGSMDIDINARNGSIAQLNLDSAQPNGKIDVALPTIAWDEDLIEIDAPHEHAAHPFPASSACLVHAEPDAGAQRHVRLFAMDECVLGRHDGDGEAEGDLLLEHYGEHGPERAGLTRRLSARHALIRPARGGFEIEDVSRYGLLLDGVWPGKHAPQALRLGMRIELTASIRGVVTLVVTALAPHALVLHRVDAGGAAESFMLLAPDVAPALAATGTTLPRAALLPVLFHRGGGFWHLDPVSGEQTPLTPTTPLERLAGFGARVRFTGGARPEDCAQREPTNIRRRALAAFMHGA